MNNIACIVVTYNRLELLKQCINALLHQSFEAGYYPPILVSTFTFTEEREKNDWLEKYRVEKWLKENPQIKFFTQENLGGAGGFHNGIKYAYQSGYDYFWIMDDDGISDRFCLEKLISVAKQGSQYVAPLLYTETGTCHWPYLLNTKFNELSHSGGPFNAILLSRKLIECVGLPNKYYFIWGDEFEFLNRVKEAFFHTTLVKDAIHYHKIPENKNTIDKRIYYKVRNLIWSTRLSNGILRSKLSYRSSTIFQIVKYCFHYLLHFKYTSLFYVLRGIKDGISMDLDILRHGSNLQD